MRIKHRYSALGIVKWIIPFCLLVSCGELTDYELPSAIQATDMSLGMHSVDIMVGDRLQIPCVFTPEEVSNLAVFWSSYDTNIVTFEDNTLVAVSEGTTMVKAISVSEQLEDSCLVNVVPRWKLNIAAYPYDMVIYADVSVHGQNPDENMMIGALCDDELRGLGVIENRNGISYMVIRVWSPFEYGDIIRIGCYRIGQAIIEYFPDEFVFDGETHGTLSNLYPLSIQ